MNRCWTYLALLLALFSVGCGGNGAPADNERPIRDGDVLYTNVTGDWYFKTSLTGTTTTPSRVQEIYAYLDNSSTNSGGKIISGVIHVFGCMDIPADSVMTDIPVRGTLDLSGNAKLTSDNVQGNVFEFTMQFAASRGTGTFTVSGNGCASGAAGTLSEGVKAERLTGTWKGYVNVETTPLLKFKTDFAQTNSPDAKGYYHLSGTMDFINDPCFTRATIDPTNTWVAGGNYMAKLTSSNGDIWLYGMLPDPTDGGRNDFSYYVVGGSCNDAGNWGIMLHD